MTNIDELRERLDNPTEGETFTPEEVHKLMEWYADSQVTNAYNQARIANTMTEAKRATQIVQDTMAKIESLYQTPVAPRLEVVTYG